MDLDYLYLNKTKKKHDLPLGMESYDVATIWYISQYMAHDTFHISAHMIYAIVSNTLRYLSSNLRVIKYVIQKW